ncbi:MAG: Flp family type IVb pilin [Caulobacteraceae bacterium]|nr:Flp family type IVb pilin [Caulobacteraceae bacterium]
MRIIAFMHRLRSDSGVTSIEYALIASLISIAILGGLTALSGGLQLNYQDTADKIAAAGS